MHGGWVFADDCLGVGFKNPTDFEWAGKIEAKNMNDRPDWSPDTIAKVETFLTKESLVFEWGTGWSTLWLAERCRVVYTMEHSREWYERIWKCAMKGGVDNIVFNIFSLEEAAYYETILSTPKPDLIIIDGRNRIKCLREAVKVGSIILLDDSERVRYHEAFQMGLEEEDTKPDERGQKATFFK